jgi:hypothetical protein
MNDQQQKSMNRREKPPLFLSRFTEHLEKQQIDVTNGV